jgi:hypothetical protein
VVEVAVLGRLPSLGRDLAGGVGDAGGLWTPLSGSCGEEERVAAAAVAHGVGGGRRWVVAVEGAWLVLTTDIGNRLTSSGVGKGVIVNDVGAPVLDGRAGVPDVVDLAGRGRCPRCRLRAAGSMRWGHRAGAVSVA